MSGFTRRRFIQIAGASGIAAAAGLGSGCSNGRSGLFGKKVPPRVVVVGGGFGGAVAAKYLRMADPGVDVTLVEGRARYVTCPFSNLVIAGRRSIDSISYGYATLADKYGVKVLNTEVIDVDPEKRTLRLRGNADLEYDYLIVSPGIDFRWNEIEGYDADASYGMPHAWKAGEQTSLLRGQLQAMPNGGLVVIAAPANPYRCPPGPYERAGLIADYLQRHKPRSKVLILDAKNAFAKQSLFVEGWKELYGDMVEWVSAADGGKVQRVHVARGLVSTEFDDYRPAVGNIIPPQKAGFIADRAGLTDSSGWCPVDQGTFESTLVPGVYVIGDAAIAGKMPKSGVAANTQAKVAAAAVLSAIRDQPLGKPSYLNTCYSLVGPQYGISVAAVYRLGADHTIVPVQGAGGVSPADGDRALEAIYATNWYDNITADMFS